MIYRAHFDGLEALRNSVADLDPKDCCKVLKGLINYRMHHGCSKEYCHSIALLVPDEIDQNGIIKFVADYTPFGWQVIELFPNGVCSAIDSQKVFMAIDEIVSLHEKLTDDYYYADNIEDIPLIYFTSTLETIPHLIGLFKTTEERQSAFIQFIFKKLQLSDEGADYIQKFFYYFWNTFISDVRTIDPLIFNAEFLALLVNYGLFTENVKLQAPFMPISVDEMKSIIDFCVKIDNSNPNINKFSFLSHFIINSGFNKEDRRKAYDHLRIALLSSPIINIENANELVEDAKQVLSDLNDCESRTQWLGSLIKRCEELGQRDQARVFANLRKRSENEILSDVDFAILVEEALEGIKELRLDSKEEKKESKRPLSEVADEE